MSMKENVDFVKGELNSEEKFLEGFVKVERVFKKYKFAIIAVVLILIALVVAFNVKNYMDEQNLIKANKAFEAVLANPNDKESLATLKETNSRLYQVASYLNGNKEEIQVRYLKELVAYDKALNENNVEKLNDLSMQSDFLLKEFAIFNKALLLANDGKYEEAKTALKLIPTDSKAFELAKLLNHYLATK
ncbi:hypothetical protein ACH5BF_12830 [Arcobacter sp. YIC-464]|uniref:hypothetical protein n=1 Tax=Arcobacter sp. YIC-464 TaxID=3376631 RepID=UPI003C1E01C6